MSEEEKKAIEEQYKEGLVNLSNVIEPLINQFKVDYSLDIQQCRLIINYLLMERDFNEDYYDELDKEIEKKDKIIDLMAKTINEAFFASGDFEVWFEDEICKVQRYEDYTYVEKDIKQYFERGTK